MATISPRRELALLETTERRKTRWGIAHYFALAGAPLLLWETWTVVAWLLDSPSQITQYRQPDSWQWSVTKFWELVCVVVAVVVGTIVVRDCMKRRKVFTFDVMFLIGGFSLVWLDGITNFFVPSLLYSSHWTNLNAMCGHMPFIVNPDCGRLPDPLLFMGVLNSFGALGLAMVGGRLIHRLRGRRPQTSAKRIVIIGLVVGIIVDLLLELPMISMGLFTYTTPPFLSIPLADDLRFALPSLLLGGPWLAGLTFLRTFKDDRGRAIVERGFDHLTPRRRQALTMLALYGAMQMLTGSLGTIPIWSYGPYISDWPKLPSYLLNDICDGPGVSGTRYGPCPGDPGFRLPGRHSLPGESP